MRMLAVVLGWVGWSAVLMMLMLGSVLLAVCCSGVARGCRPIGSDYAPLNSGFDSLVL